MKNDRKLALVGKFLIKFSSLSAPTKIEELTAGSDEKNTVQPRRESNPGSYELLVARSNHWATAGSDEKNTVQPRRESNPGSYEF